MPHIALTKLMTFRYSHHL